MPIYTNDNNDIEVIRIKEDCRISSKSFSEAFEPENNSFLFISPHDDDAVLGSGLIIQQAIKEDIPVYLLVVTDGSMGYCSEGERDSISETRKDETYQCYEALGVKKENIIWLSYPDCQLFNYRGRSFSAKGDQTELSKANGLQNSFTYWIRKTKPTHCFLPTVNDLHPDHKIVHEEFLISIFHAQGDIWPELGESIKSTPYVHEMGVYCNFSSNPTLRINTSKELYERKIEAIREFKSQLQIESLIQIVADAGPYEYFKTLEFNMYNPSEYFDLFEDLCISADR